MDYEYFGAPYISNEKCRWRHVLQAIRIRRILKIQTPRNSNNILIFVERNQLFLTMICGQYQNVTHFGKNDFLAITKNKLSGTKEYFTTYLRVLF